MATVCRGFSGHGEVFRSVCPHSLVFLHHSEQITAHHSLQAGAVVIEFTIRRLSKPLPEKEREQIVRIAAHYFPPSFDVESMLDEHLGQDTCVHVAEQGDRIVGFSVHSFSRRKTPFHKQDLPVFFQRLLYVDPAVQHKAVGLKLQTRGLRFRLGLFWLFRRFVVICLTSNPQVLRAMSQYNEYYPRRDGVLPESVYVFCQQLGSMMGFSRIDRRLLVYGTNETLLEGEDYSSEWASFLRSGHTEFDQMILQTAFSTKNDRVTHSGSLLLAIGYARPMHFLRRFIELSYRYHR